METDRAEWLAERARIPGVGASESACLFGLHPHLSAFALFERLMNPQPPTEEEAEEMTDVQEFGLAIEPALASWYARKTGREVIERDKPLYRLAEKPYIFATPDRFYATPDFIGGCLQLKSGIHFNPSEPLPDSWEIQEQHEMLVCESKVASFAIWATFRKRYYVNDIPANPSFQEILVEQIDAFMAMIGRGVYDPGRFAIDGSKATREALARLYRKPAGTEVSLTDEDQGRAEQWQSLKEQIRTLEAAEATLNNQLRAAVGTNGAGILPDGSRLKRIDVKGSTYQVIKEPSWYLKLAKPAKEK